MSHIPEAPGRARLPAARGPAPRRPCALGLPRAAPSGSPSQQWHEGYGTECFAFQALLAARESHQLLLPLGADRHDEACADLELPDERIGYGERCRCHQDCVEGRLRFPAERAVAMAEAHVADAELLQALAGA